MNNSNTSNQAPRHDEPRLVDCVRLGRRLPGLATPPFANELGQRIFTHISAQAWQEWLEHSKLLVNEHGLRLSDPAARTFLLRQCEAFLFEGGSAPPSGFTPRDAALLQVRRAASGPRPNTTKSPDADD